MNRKIQKIVLLLQYEVKKATAEAKKVTTELNLAEIKQQEMLKQKRESNNGIYKFCNIVTIP